MSALVDELADTIPAPASEADVYAASREIRRMRAARAKTLESKPDARAPDASATMAIGVALFGACSKCSSLLEVDGSCPNAREHEKSVCESCGAEHDEPLSVARPCLFCGGDRASA